MKYPRAILLWSIWIVCGFAAESRPVKLNLPLLECSERTVEHGIEADCIYKTQNGDWSIGYSKEGKEKRSLKYKLKNLVVLLHPSESHYRLREGWLPMVGPGKPLDPEKNVLLSVGLIGDGKPKVGSEKRLSDQVILEAIHAILDQVYPGADFFIGGPSRGGQVAYLYALTHPDRVKGLFMVSATGFISQKDRAYKELFTNQILNLELALGPPSDWSSEQQRDFWRKYTVDTLSTFFTPKFFQTPESMSEIGKTKDDYKDEATFRKQLADSWVDWSSQQTDVAWFETQAQAIFQGLDRAQKEKRYPKLPKSILLVYALNDGLTTAQEYGDFASALRQAKKNVQEVKIEGSILGHMACCSWPIAEEVRSSVGAFVQP